MGKKKWTDEKIEILLSLETDEELTEAFPKQKLESLRRVQRKFRQEEQKPITYKEKAEKYDINKLLKKQSLFDHIGEVFVSAIERLPAQPIPNPPAQSENDEEEMCFIFSDSQIGEVVNPKETGGLGNYSTEVFEERLDFLIGSLKKIFTIHKKEVPYKRINLFFVGDIIEGSTIFKGQLRSIDSTAVEQVMKAVNKISHFVAWLATEFPEVGCYCVVGNHGRIGDFGVNSPMDNLDYLVYKWMEERLANQENVEINIAETWWMAVERQKTRFVLVHGDDIRAWMGIPFYGASRSEARMQKLLNINFNFYIIGHHHQKADFDNILMNGCWVGGSEFSLKRLQAGGLPTQMLFSIHHIFGITWKRDVLLINPKEIKPTKIYQ